MPEVKHISIREYAELTGVSKETVRNMCVNTHNKQDKFPDGYIPVKVDTTWILYKIID